MKYYQHFYNRFLNGLNFSDTGYITLKTKCNCLALRFKNRHYFTFIMLFIFQVNLVGQDLFMPENPLKGRFVFEQKGCINCHSISGEGGEVAPDLGEKIFYGSFLELASIMWNHVPDMQRQMRELDLSFPEFIRSEMIELIAYLYYLRYLGEPGDLYRGKILVEEKGCLTCHSIGDKGGGSGPAFDKLARYISPLYMAQTLWNHGPQMEDKMREKGLSLPKFEKGEIVDLSTYIQAASIGINREEVYMSPGNPQKGKVVFLEKGCSKCHAVQGHGNDVGPDLNDIARGNSVAEIAAIMWNHSSAMRESMEEKNINWPKFSAKQMADLIAYMYFMGFEDEIGDPQNGKILFSEKMCGYCHGEDATGGEIAPDLSKTITLLSSIDLAQIMWNHAPDMEERISEIDLIWPEFKVNEMADLYAFLRTLKKIVGEE